MMTNASTIQYREGVLDEADVEVRSCQNTKPGSPNHLRTQSGGQNIGVAPSNSGQVSSNNESIASIDYTRERRTDVSSLDHTEDPSTPRRRSDAQGGSDGYVESSTRHRPGSSYSTCSSSREVDIARIPSFRSRGSDNWIELNLLPQSTENLHHSSYPSVLVCAKFWYIRHLC